MSGGHPGRGTEAWRGEGAGSGYTEPFHALPLSSAHRQIYFVLSFVLADSSGTVLGALDLEGQLDTSNQFPLPIEAPSEDWVASPEALNEKNPAC